MGDVGPIQDFSGTELCLRLHDSPQLLAVEARGQRLIAGNAHNYTFGELLGAVGPDVIDGRRAAPAFVGLEDSQPAIFCSLENLAAVKTNTAIARLGWAVRPTARNAVQQFGYGFDRSEPARNPSRDEVLQRLREHGSYGFAVAPTGDVVASHGRAQPELLQQAGHGDASECVIGYLLASPGAESDTMTIICEGSHARMTILGNTLIGSWGLPIRQAPLADFDEAPFQSVAYAMPTRLFAGIGVRRMWSMGGGEKGAVLVSLRTREPGLRSRFVAFIKSFGLCYNWAGGGYFTVRKNRMKERIEEPSYFIWQGTTDRAAAIAAHVFSEYGEESILHVGRGITTIHWGGTGKTQPAEGRPIPAHECGAFCNNEGTVDCFIPWYQRRFLGQAKPGFHAATTTAVDSDADQEKQWFVERLPTGHLASWGYSVELNQSYREDRRRIVVVGGQTVASAAGLKWTDDGSEP